MSYIDSVNAGGTTYKIQETMYIAPSLSGTAYTASLTNFTLAIGATVQAKFANTNPANATLNVNSTGAKNIFYNGARITASQFKVNHTYTLVYDGTQWQVVGDIDTNTQSAYGNISTSGTLQTNDITIANGDKLVITDSSDSSKIARSSVTFDGSTTNKALTPKGTWEILPTITLVTWTA